MMPGYRDPRKAVRAVAIVCAIIGAVVVAILYAFVLVIEHDGGEPGQPVKVYGAGR